MTRPNLAAHSLGVALCMACIADSLRAQTPPTTLPTPTVVSTGGSTRSAPLAQSSGLRNASPTAWTGVNSTPMPAAASDNGRQGVSEPSGKQAYVSSGVVTAAAQTELPHPRNEPQPGSRSMGVTHIPLDLPSEGDTERPDRAAPGSLQALLSIGSSLLIVVGLFLGVAWCYRKTLHTSIGGGLPQQVVNVLGRTPLAARQQMVLVRFGSKLVLVSVIQGEARTLSEITDPLEVDQLVGLCEAAKPGSISHSFKNVLLQEGAS